MACKDVIVQPLQPLSESSDEYFTIFRRFILKRKERDCYLSEVSSHTFYLCTVTQRILKFFHIYFDNFLMCDHNVYLCCDISTEHRDTDVAIATF